MKWAPPFFLFLTGLRHASIAAAALRIDGSDKHEDHHRRALLLFDDPLQFVCGIFPYWPLANLCAENSPEFCQATPQNAPDICTENSSANCPYGLKVGDIAARAEEDLTGKVALVTGGRSGLGLAITEVLLGRGCKVIIASRNQIMNTLAVLRLQIRNPGADVSFLTFDLESLENVRSFAATFLESHTRLDYYFGNAGQGASNAQPLTVDGYERIFQVNYVSQVLLVELLLPLLRQSQPSRIILTASSTHSQSCGALKLGEECWGDGSAKAILPLNQTGLDALNGTFDCFPIFNSYPVTKYLLLQAARELGQREKDLGNQVYTYAWAPGNIFTDLNPFGAICCFGAELSDDTSQCALTLSYVGPRDVNGNPDPPAFFPLRLLTHWTSTAHGAMAAIYAALLANPEDSGSFIATHNECQPEEGYFSLGITPTLRSELYELAKSWAGME